MTYKLFLDDIRDPPDESWKVVRTVDEAIELVKTLGLPYIMSLDHDLGENQKTGMDFAKWLVDRDFEGWFDLEKCWVDCHSANPIGSENILGLIKAFQTWKRRLNM